MLQVSWESYDGERALPFPLSNMCGCDYDLYRMRCPLICFYAVKFYQPDRVARQFGVRRLWSTAPFLTGVDIHK